MGGLRVRRELQSFTQLSLKLLAPALVRLALSGESLHGLALLIELGTDRDAPLIGQSLPGGHLRLRLE
jgi:hypothetical protein